MIKKALKLMRVNGYDISDMERYLERMRRRALFSGTAGSSRYFAVRSQSAAVPSGADTRQGCRDAE
jgi:hypothetical protein